MASQSHTRGHSRSLPPRKCNKGAVIVIRDYTIGSVPWFTVCLVGALDGVP